MPTPPGSSADYLVVQGTTRDSWCNTVVQPEVVVVGTSCKLSCRPLDVGKRVGMLQLSNICRGGNVVLVGTPRVHRGSIARVDSCTNNRAAHAYQVVGTECTDTSVPEGVVEPTLARYRCLLPLLSPKINKYIIL